MRFESASPIELLAAFLDGEDGLAHDPASWAAIKSHANRHGVAQLAAFAARSRVQPSERAWCDQILTRSWNRHVRNLGELEHAAGILQAGGVPVLAMKGPLLACRHYQPAFLRKTSSDLDLAVNGRDIARAAELLEAEGYTGEASVADALARNHHLAMQHPSRPGIELHFRLSHAAYGIPVGEFFGRAVPFQLPSGLEVLVMSPADELFHLVLHRAYGRFATLFHLCEIRRLWTAASAAVRTETLRRAAEHHFAGAFALTDVAFQVRWGERLLAPGDLPRTWLQGRITERLYRQFEEWSDPGRELPLAVRMGRRWIDFQLTDRPADARRFLGVMARVAWHQIRHRGWETVRVSSPSAGYRGQHPSPVQK